MIKRTLILFSLAAFLTAPLASLAAEAEAELQVGNLSCGSCLVRIHKTISALDGANGISRYDFPSRRVWFPYDSDNVTAEAISQAVNDLGYPARVIDDGLQK